jgi:RNA polymerase-binding transcription factor DksA
MDVPEPPAPVTADSSSAPEAPVAASIEAAVASLAAIERELDRVQASLDQLDAGTYGSCEVCGETIGDDRLEADPTATRCAAHAATDETADVEPADSSDLPDGEPG